MILSLYFWSQMNLEDLCELNPKICDAFKTSPDALEGVFITRNDDGAVRMIQRQVCGPSTEVSPGHIILGEPCLEWVTLAPEDWFGYADKFPVARNARGNLVGTQTGIVVP